MTSPCGADAPAPADLVIRRLATLCILAPEEMAAVRAACAHMRSLGSGEELGPPGARLFLLSGWACRARLLPDGRRQLVSFLLPGDIIDLPGAHQIAPHRTFTLTRATTADAQGVVGRACAAGFSLAAASETIRHLDQIVRLAALSASQGMVHLLLELHNRLGEVGLAHEGRFPMPLSQEVLAGALGLSEVHTNRVLGQLRRDGLVELGPGWIRLRDLLSLRATLPQPPTS